MGLTFLHDICKKVDAVAMDDMLDGTGRALASAFDAVKDSFASAATSLSASAATVEYEKFSSLAAASMEETVKTLTSTTASLSSFLSAAYDKMKNKKPSPRDLVKLAILSSEERM